MCSYYIVFYKNVLISDVYSPMGIYNTHFGNSPEEHTDTIIFICVYLIKGKILQIKIIVLTTAINFEDITNVVLPLSFPCGTGTADMVKKIIMYHLLSSKSLRDLLLKIQWIPSGGVLIIPSNLLPLIQLWSFLWP